MNWDEVFGTGDPLTPLQMAVRAFITFFIALALIRFGGMRIFGKKTAFDNIIVFMLGTLLGNGVLGTVPYMAVIAASTTMLLIHKILAWLAMKYIWVGKIVKGYRHSLYKNKELNERNMRRTHISKDDIYEGVRLEINEDTFDNVKEIYMEKTGQISVVKQEKK
jgi:uncharacterized membrane protein YcaP (DUF421 family)